MKAEDSKSLCKVSFEASTDFSLAYHIDKLQLFRQKTNIDTSSNKSNSFLTLLKWI